MRVRKVEDGLTLWKHMSLYINCNDYEAERRLTLKCVISLKMNSFFLGPAISDCI